MELHSKAKTTTKTSKPAAPDEGEAAVEDIEQEQEEPNQKKKRGGDKT